MRVCELLLTCAFIAEEMKQRPALTSVLKEEYCKGDNSKCARHIVYEAMGRKMDKVPNDLFPNQVWRAERIVIK
jgi:hypothetical protein